jgi:hypothetical protein
MRRGNWAAPALAEHDPTDDRARPPDHQRPLESPAQTEAGPRPSLTAICRKDPSVAGAEFATAETGNAAQVFAAFLDEARRGRSTRGNPDLVSNLHKQLDAVARAGRSVILHRDRPRARRQWAAGVRPKSVCMRRGPKPMRPTALLSVSPTWRIDMRVIRRSIALARPKGRRAEAQQELARRS